MGTTQDTKTYFYKQNDLIKHLENHSDDYFKLEQEEWRDAIGTTTYQNIMKERRAKLPWLKECLEELSKSKSIQETITITYTFYDSIFHEFSHPDYRQWKFRKYGMRLSKMELILKHLKCEMKTEKEKIPKFNHELGYLKADFDYKKKRKKFLKQSTQKGKRTILFWGDGSFNTNFKKNNCSPCHSIRDFFTRACKSKVDLILVNEDYTSKHCSVCEKEIDKKNDTTFKINGTKKEYRLRKCNFCLDAQRPSFFERDMGSSSFILKRGMKEMIETKFLRKQIFINNQISSLWSTSLIKT